MKKNFLRDNAWFIIIGLILLIVNIILDLGVFPLQIVKDIAFLYWLVSIVSKICSSVGLALIIGFITKLINSNNEEENQKEVNRRNWEERIENLLTDQKNNNTTYDYLYSREHLDSFPEEKKKQIINNCLFVSFSKKQKFYLDHKVSQLYECERSHIRSNIDYVTTASKENGKVKLHTVMSYRFYKTSDGYPEIVHSFDKPTTKISSMLILYGENNNKKKYEVPESDLITKEKIIHQNEKYYVNKVNIPETITNEPYITLKITVEEEGYDHWAHLVWMSLYPTDTITYKIICKDNLTIKDPSIFDNQDGLYYTHEERNEKGQINEYTISCDEWTDKYTGFSLIISEP